MGFDRMCVLDAKTGHTLFTVADGTDQTVKFSPDGKTLAVIGRSLMTVDSRTGRILRTLIPRLWENYILLAFSSDSKRLAVGYAGTGFIWDLETGQCLWKMAHHDGVSALAFFPDNRYLLVGPTGDVVDTTTGTSVRRLTEQEGGLEQICFSPDGKQIATGGGDKIARIWDAKTSKLLRVLKGHSEGITSVCFSPDGKTLATGSADATVRLWDLTAREEPYAVSRRGGPVNAAAISPDGKWFVTGNESGDITCWNMQTGKELYTTYCNWSAWDKDRHVNPSLRDVCISPDGGLIAFAGDGRWVEARGAQSECLQMLIRRDATVRALCFTPAGNCLVIGGSDHLARIVTIPTSRESTRLSHEVRRFRGHTGTILSVCVSPDGKRLLTAGEDKTARVWDMATGRQLLLLRGHTDDVTCARFSHDGTHIVTASFDGTVQVWNAATGHPELHFHAHVTGVLSACFSPDDRRILTAGNDKTAKLWDAKTGRELLTLRGHTSRVTFAGFSPDGTRIITAGYDEFARIWSAPPPAFSLSSSSPALLSTR